MNKKNYIIVGVCAVIAIALGIYFFNEKSGSSTIDFEAGQEKTCVIANTQQEFLLTYTKSTKTFVSAVNPDNNEITGTCELPFNNNENIYISQSTTKELYIYNDAQELFKFNGTHFLKIPSNLYTGNTDVRIQQEEGQSTAIIDLSAGSIHVQKEIKNIEGYTLKNAYLYSNLKDMETLDLFELSDPGKEITDSYIAMRIMDNGAYYYVFFDANTREQLRCVANPFETTEGGFQTLVENDKPLLFVGEQTFDVNANEIITHDAITVDAAVAAITYGPYSEINKASSLIIKASDNQTHNYILQSPYKTEFAYVIYK